MAAVEDTRVASPLYPSWKQSGKHSEEIPWRLQAKSGFYQEIVNQACK